MSARACFFAAKAMARVPEERYSDTRVMAEDLQAYLDEFVFCYICRFYPMTGFASILGIGMGVSAPTYQELYDGAWDHHTRSAVS